MYTIIGITVHSTVYTKYFIVSRIKSTLIFLHNHHHNLICLSLTKYGHLLKEKESLLDKFSMPWITNDQILLEFKEQSLTQLNIVLLESDAVKCGLAFS